MCIDWSYELCTAQEQQVWGRLSVFAGSFELDAAEQICGSDMKPGDLLDVVTSLVDKSILIREEPNAVVRFRLLETLREYGREKAQQSNAYEGLCRRHRDWFRQFVVDAEADWISSRQLEWIARYDREQPNLREAMEFCLSSELDDDVQAGLRIASGMYLIWGTRGLLSEGRRWLDRFLARHTGSPTVGRVKALYVNSVLAEQQGDLHRGGVLLQEGRSIAEHTSDPEVHALVAHADGLLSLFSGDLGPACSHMEDALTMFRATGNLMLQVEALLLLGLAYELHDESTVRAIECYEEVLAITESRGESVYRSYTLWAMAVAQWRQDNHSRANELLKQGLRLARLVNDPVGSANCLEALAWTAGSGGDHKRAGVLMGAAEYLGHAAGSSPVFVPNLDVYHAECERTTRQTLGQRMFESARSEGQALGLDAAIAYALGEQPPKAPISPRPSMNLTKREREVAELIAEGLTNKAIAARLVISQRTAQGHVEHVLAKLGFTSRTQIAAWIVEDRQSS
ncbi:LuxR C-terminal-related transcriptional regulator [Rhodococcus sp. JVH1]|uniref:ATP-binding protein n=1 Tax=Rhodococcus sp. JVH1 TaxID=745408 RepID=UPI0002721890|nr:transcriptional regulator, LuxR family [Rhodococcus sp. JVH1]